MGEKCQGWSKLKISIILKEQNCCYFDIGEWYY